MKRVFRDEIKNELIKNADDGVRQWDNFQRDLSSWINKYSEYADSYLKSSLNMYTSDLNTVLLGGKTRIEKIFRDVESVETSYSNSFSDVATEMTLYSSKINALRNAIQPIGGVNVFESSRFMVSFNKAKADIFEQEVLDLIANPSKVKNLEDSRREKIVKYISETSEKYSGVDIKSVPEAERNLLVYCYEALNPDNKEKMDNFLEPLSDEGLTNDIMNIKFISYRAEEPIKTILFHYLPEIEIASLNEPKPYYKAGKIYVNLVSNNGLENPRGAYFTFFHEVGHAVDYAMKQDGVFDRANSGLQDIARNDVNNYIDELLIKLDITGDDYTAIYDSILNNDTSNLKIGQHKKYQDVMNTYNQALKKINPSPAKYNVVTDVYGGYTNNALKTGYGHGDDYWTGTAQSSELYAHYFATNTTQAQPQMEAFNVFFTESTEFLDSKMEKIAKKIGSK